MILNKQIIDHAQTLLTLDKFYDKAEDITPQHILFKEFRELTVWKQLPKLVFYICMAETFGHPVKDDKQPLLGFRVKPKQPLFEYPKPETQNAEPTSNA